MPAPAQRANARKALSHRKIKVGKGQRFTLRAGSAKQRWSWSRTLIKGVAFAMAVFSFTSSTRATFPGQNGHIAYNPRTSDPLGGSYTYISVVGAGQFTFPPAGVRQDSDSSPVWSPSGDQLAFVRFDGTSLAAEYLIEVLSKDGTGLQTIFSSSALNGAFSEISSLTWTPDGQRISFFVFDIGPGTARDTVLGSTTGIWTVNLDGTGLTEVVGGVPNHNGSSTLLSNLEGLNGNNQNAQIFLAWSSKNELAFTCNFRLNNITADLCILNADTGETRQLPIIWPNAAPESRSGTSHPSPWDWSPDGKKIIFSDNPQDVGLGGGGGPQIFSINADGTGLTQLTNPPLLACPPGTGGNFSSANYSNPRYSPDGQFIVAITQSGAHLTTFPGNPEEGIPDSCGLIGAVASVSVLPALGGSSSIVTPLSSFSSSQLSAPIDWQPIPQGLAFHILDGHGNAIKGLRVELRQSNVAADPIDSQPINTGGTYVFQDGLVPGQEYLIRATLIDGCSGSCTPAFDIHYAPKSPPDEPVWEEWSFNAPQSQTSSYTFNFGGDPPFIGTNVPEAIDLLPDMATNFLRVRQYVDWLAANISPSSMPTASFYTFATVDPVDGSNASILQEFGGYYKGGTSIIVLSPAKSAFATQDPHGGGDLYIDWHEFTHYLWAKFVSSAGCNPNDSGHLGYNNPDTCSSLNEGFAEFLPTLAGRDIIGERLVPSGDGFLVSNSMFGSNWDLSWPTFAWLEFELDGAGNPVGGEEYAVAALLWDLVARSGNTQASGVIGANGLPVAVTYTNVGPNIPVGQLWTQLTSHANVPTPITLVSSLRESFGSPALTIDLDGDGVPDVAPIDIPFLMHGFYPIDSDQTVLIRTPNNYIYDVGYAQRHGVPTRNFFVGRTDHYVYDATNTSVVETLIPRVDAPRVANANLGITVLDSIGAPLPGATVEITINYPGGQTFISRQLDSTGLVYLELPPYFNYLLPQGGPLPACNPTTDLHVTVTLSISAQGQTSTTTPSFDNCTYWHAVAAATTPAALSFTVTVPVIGSGGGDTTPPTTTAALSAQANGAGWNNSSVTATLTATDDTSGSGVKQITYGATGAQTIASTVVNGSSASFTINTEGVTTITFFGTDNAGNVESTNTLMIQLDKTAPSLNCGTLDGVWHPNDVSIACSSADSLSGLANSTDANFSLATNVPVGTETASAATGTHSVCDVAGNCATVGPMVGNMVDKKAPSISVSSPASGASYLLNQAVNANFTCTDGGSGVATCAGPVANGSAISTASVGSRTFTVSATDNAGNVAPAQTVGYSVTNAVCLLYDPTRSVQSGSTVPLKIQLCDANNADVSSSGVVVHALSLLQTGTNASAVLQASGNANPDNDFRFDPTLGPTGGYIFNLSTKGLTTGSYQLTFTASSDPTPHILSFQVR